MSLKAVAVKVDEGGRPGAKLDGTDVTSGGAVVVAVDVAGKASLVSAKQRPRISFIAVNYTTPPCSKADLPGSRQGRPHRWLDLPATRA